MLDYHVVLDLLPTTASLYFQKRLEDDVRLSAVQSAILLALGLQRKTVEEVEVSYGNPLQDIPRTQRYYRQNFNFPFRKLSPYSSRLFGKSRNDW